MPLKTRGYHIDHNATMLICVCICIPKFLEVMRHNDDEKLSVYLKINEFHKSYTSTLDTYGDQVVSFYGVSI